MSLMMFWTPLSTLPLVIRSMTVHAVTIPTGGLYITILYQTKFIVVFEYDMTLDRILAVSSTYWFHNRCIASLNNRCCSWRKTSSAVGISEGGVDDDPAAAAVAASAAPEAEEEVPEADDGMLDAITDCDAVEDAVVLLPPLLLSSVRENKFDNGNVIFASTRMMTLEPLSPEEDDDAGDEDRTTRNQNANVCSTSKNVVDSTGPLRGLGRCCRCCRGRRRC
mmetsp:Transcript_14702/g.35907  ORF Transcript_14702/g.35907 Transcript_14702/m.35907 type:complete len:222 (-) Transcript_14702:239-904(-)